MAIPENRKANFNTLIDAIKNNDVCLVKCKKKGTDELVYVICAMNHMEDGTVSLAPFAKLFDDNPYEELDPPMLGDENVLETSFSVQESD